MISDNISKRVVTISIIIQMGFDVVAKLFTVIYWILYTIIFIYVYVITVLQIYNKKLVVCKVVLRDNF